MDKMEKSICGAKTRSKFPCRRSPMANGRCRLHGGKTPAGIASPHFKTGRYSKYLPGDLTELYQHSRRDPGLLALRDDLALLRARLCQLLQSAESQNLWYEAKSAWVELKKSIPAKDQKTMKAGIEKLDDIFERGLKDVGTWQEIYQVVEQSRQLRATEHRRLHDKQLVMTAAEGFTLIRAMTAAVRATVTDPETLRRISEEFGKIAGPNDTQGDWDNPYSDDGHKETPDRA